MICRWYQELLGYHFSTVHQSNKMMVDVDDLTRISGKLISQYCTISYILHNTDKQRRPKVHKE